MHHLAAKYSACQYSAHICNCAVCYAYADSAPCYRYYSQTDVQLCCSPDQSIDTATDSSGTAVLVTGVTTSVSVTIFCIMMMAMPVQVLVTADKEELNFILLNVNCAALAEVVSRITMDMLTGSGSAQRLPELQVLTRSAFAVVF